MGVILLSVGIPPRGGLALSSVEAEYYAMVEAATRAMGVKNLAEELGVQAEITLFTD